MPNQRYAPKGRQRRSGGASHFGENPAGSSNSNSNSNNNDAQHSILGYKTAKDPLHNGASPVCQILNDAIADVFPELDANAKANANANANATPNRKQPLPQGLSRGSSLGQMIRRKYLFARMVSMMATAPQPLEFDHLFQEHGGTNHPSNSNSNKNSSKNSNKNDSGKANGTEVNPGAAKKKRKRKKKKKRQASAAASLPSSVVAAGDEPDGESETEVPIKDHDHDHDEKNSDYDGKSMMSNEDHSLEALDEAVKIETEKMIQEEANFKRPSLSAFPSDDNLQAEECPSQFIDQIRPQEENSAAGEESHHHHHHHHEQHHEQHHPCHFPTPGAAQQQPNGTSSLPEDVGSNDDDDNDVLWKNPLALPFLVSVGPNGPDNNALDKEGGGDSTVRDHNGRTVTPTPHEATRSLFFEWMDQSFLGVPDSDDRRNRDYRSEPGGASPPKSETERREIQREWDSFLEFCNQPGSVAKPGIALRDLRDISERIECKICRDEARSELEAIATKTVGAAPLSLASSSLPPPSPSKSSSSCSSTCRPTVAKSPRVVMKPSFLEKPSPPTVPDHDVEAAFDYVALEEGNLAPMAADDGTNEAPPDEYDSFDEGTLGSSLSFLAASADAKPKRSGGSKKSAPTDAGVATPAGEQYLFLQGPTTEQLDGFLNEWLTAGVDEEQLVRMSIQTETGQSNNSSSNNDDDNNNSDQADSLVLISANDLETIQNTVKQTQLLYTTSLDRMIVELGEMKIQPVEKNVDLVGISSSMEKCEEPCDEFLTDTILPILTRELSASACHFRADLQIRFWANYLGALETMLRATDTYYQRLHQDLADQNGKLPLFFISAPYRSLYRTLAEEKIKALSLVGTRFVNDLNSPATREFYTRHVWEQRELERARENGGECGEFQTTTHLDDDCRDLLVSLTGWTRVINKPRMSAVNNERRKRLEAVFGLLQDVGESLRTEYETVERHFSKDSQRYFSWLLSNIHLAHGVKCRMRLIEMDDVVSLTTGVLLMWRHVRIMQSRVARSHPHSHSHSPERLPLSLRRWMWQEPISPDNACSKCWHGAGGGKRRVMGILAGLTYAWLQERCNEWKAEIARQELLTSFEDDEVSKPVGKAGGPGNKPSKKSKKKNKATTPLSSNRSSQNHGDDNAGNNVLEPNHKEMPRGKHEHEQGETNGISVQHNGSTISSDENDPWVGNESCDGTEDDCGSTVGVRDDCGSVIPAMDFLTGRLAELMKQAEDDSVCIVPS